MNPNEAPIGTCVHIGSEHLESREHQDHRQSKFQVVESVDHLRHQEVQRAETEDSENVRAVYDERLLSDREDGRDGVDGEDLPKLVDPVVRGWMQYYGRFYRTECVLTLQHLNEALAAWVRRKHKRFRYRKSASRQWLRRIAGRDPKLFALWQLGVKPRG
jgi:hypothetical protein